MKVWGLQFAPLSNRSAHGTGLGLLGGLTQTYKTSGADGCWHRVSPRRYADIPGLPGQHRPVAPKNYNTAITEFKSKPPADGCAEATGRSQG